MDQRRAAAALLALAACVACSTAAPTSNNQTALDLYDAPVEGCYYNFQHYSEGDRIMTNEPCLNCTCHNRMLMCYLRVCPFTKPIGQDCTVEKRADQCCPIVTCPDVPVDLLTSTSTSSPAEYGATGLGKLDKYGCSINGKYFPEGSKVPPTPNKPCEHCYCIHNMTTCVMQECTLHVDGCTPIYHKDVCCPIRYSCDHPEDEIPLLDDMTTTVRPTPGFLLTTTTMMPVTQATQDCIHDDQIFSDGALIKTEKACEHCYCMKGDIVCVVQECGTPMENEGKNCTSLPPRQGQCCPDTYICEGDETQTTAIYEEMTTLSPPRRIGAEGSGYRNEPDEVYTEVPSLETETEGSGDDQPITIIDSSDSVTTSKPISESTSEYTSKYSTEPDKGLNTVPDSAIENGEQDTTISTLSASTTVPESTTSIEGKLTSGQEYTTIRDSTPKIHDETTISIETSTVHELDKSTISEVTTKSNDFEGSSDNMTPIDEGFILATKLPDKSDSTDSNFEEDFTTIKPSDFEEPLLDKKDQTTMKNILQEHPSVTTEKIIEMETTAIDVQENEIIEDQTPGRIPGEGDCLLNSITYKNNSVVPSSNKCHSSCKCISSIVKCDPIICTPPLEYMENMNDCHPIYDSPDSCCPTYVCNTKETIAPESHSQMSGTEAPKPTIECAGDECKIIEENKPGKDHETTNIDCGENGCTKVPVPPPCDSDNGCQVPAIKPCDSGDCGIKQETAIHDEKDVEIQQTHDLKPVNEDEEVLCKEENCRRKEFSDTNHGIQCSGNECLQKETIAPISDIDTSTQKTQNDITTRIDEDEAQQTEDLSIVHESTTKAQPNILHEMPTESTTVAELFTEKDQTSSFDMNNSNVDVSHQEDINTPPPYVSEISTEESYQKEDKTTVSLLSEHVTGESSETPKEATPEVTEKLSDVDDSSKIDEANKVTVKAETEASEYTKQITTESYIASETATPSLVTSDKSTLSQETEIIGELPKVTQIPDITTSSNLDEHIFTNQQDITTISNQIVTESFNIGSSTEREILDMEQTDKSHDKFSPEVTQHVESTTVSYLGTDLSSKVTSSDLIDDQTPDQKIPEIYESSPMYTESPKEDEIDEHPSVTVLSTQKDENVAAVSSTPAFRDETTENEGYEIQKGDERISTELPYTEQEDVKITPPIQDHSDVPATSIIDTDLLTPKPEAHTEPAEASTDSKMYSPTQETGTSVNIQDIVTEPTLDHDLSDKTGADIEQQTILSTTQSPTVGEQSDALTVSPKEEETTVKPIDQVDKEQAEIYDTEVTTKSSEESETKPIETMIQQDETDKKTTLGYNPYSESIKDVTGAEIPVIIEQSTLPPVVFYPTTDGYTMGEETMKPHQEIKPESITTEKSVTPSDLADAEKVTESAETKPPSFIYEDIVTEKVSPTERVDIITPQSQDSGDESISSTISSVIGFVTDQNIQDLTAIDQVTGKEPETPISLVTDLPSKSTIHDEAVTESVQLKEKETEIPTSIVTSITSESPVHQDETESGQVYEKETEPPTSLVTGLPSESPEHQDVTEVVQIKEKETESPMSLVTSLPSESPEHQDVTESVQVKEKETERPMSLITSLPSLSPEHQDVTESIQVKEKETESPMSLVTSLPSESPEHQDVTEGVKIKEKETESPMSYVTSVPSESPVHQDVTESVQVEEKETETPIPIVTSLPSEYPEHQDITEIVQMKEKETESPMSLVTSLPSESPEHQDVTESIQVKEKETESPTLLETELPSQSPVHEDVTEGAQVDENETEASTSLASDIPSFSPVEENVTENVEVKEKETEAPMTIVSDVSSQSPVYEDVTEGVQVEEKETGSSTSLVTDLPSHPTLDEGVTENIQIKEKETETPTAFVTDLPTQSPIQEDVTEGDQIKEKETESPISFVTSLPSQYPAHEDVTESVQEKEKETEATMSPIVTDLPSQSTVNEDVTDNVLRTTETITDLETEPHMVDEKPSSDKTELSFITDEYTSTQRSESDNNKDITSPAQFTSGYEYPRPTSESSEILTSTERELTTSRLLTSSPQLSTEGPLSTYTEQQTETTLLIDSFDSATEQQHEDDKHKEATATTEANKLSTAIDVEKGTEPSTEESSLHDQNENTQDLKDQTTGSINENITQGSVSEEISTKGSVIEDISRVPEDMASFTTEAQDVSQGITEQTPLAITETALDMNTSSEDVTIEKEKSTVMIQSPTATTPNIIISTISDNEVTYHSESSSISPTSISEDSFTKATVHDGLTTSMETLITENVPVHPSVDISQTVEPVVTADDNTIISEKPEEHTDKSQDSPTTESIQTKAPEEHVTNISEEGTALHDKEILPTLDDKMITSTEHISDSKEQELETTTENKFSETTPYFVELEEHTHQIIEETTVIPVGEVSTVETTDIKSTERGDQLFTDIPIEDTPTEKSHDETSESYETRVTTQHSIKDQTSQEKYQTTVYANRYDTTSATTIQSQKETGTTSGDISIDSDVQTTLSPLPNIMQDEERVTSVTEKSEKTTSGSIDTKVPVTTEKSHDLVDIPLVTKTPEEDRLTTSHFIYDHSTDVPVKTTVADDTYKPAENTSVAKPITSKPSSTDYQPSEEIPTPDIPSTGYDQEPDYGEEDQAFGPGTCRYGGKVYVSAQQIPRDDPCDFCFCFRSDIICLQQSCPPPIHGCHEEPIQGFCCPRYECPVSMGTTVNVTTTTTTTTTTLPPHFLTHAYKGAAQRKGCHIQGHTYKVGEVVRASSGPCLHCTCGGDGQMKCDPKACTPEPMLRQMIAAAVSARRRR